MFTAHSRDDFSVRRNCPKDGRSVWQTYFDALAYGHQLTRLLADRAGPRVDSLKADVPREECRQFVSGRHADKSGRWEAVSSAGEGRACFQEREFSPKMGLLG